MNSILQPHIHGWLRSLNMPEPDFDFVVGPYALDIAYPEDRLGLRIDNRQELVETDNWRIWVCKDEIEAFHALAEIGSRMGITPAYSPLDLEAIDRMREQGLFDAALEAIEELESLTLESHPDYQQLRVIKRQVRRERREVETGQARQPLSGSSGIVDRLRRDALRSETNYPDYNFFGFFNTQPSIVEVIDAVWIMRLREGQPSLWAAAVAEQLAGSLDSDFAISATELDLLSDVQNQLGPTTTFIWDSAQVMPTLEAWYYRSTGNRLPESYLFVDLRAICLIAFPTIKRTDRAASLCQELNLNYLDENGQASPIAAMTSLLNACINTFRTLDGRLLSQLRNVLSRTSLNGIWLDTLIPSPPESYTSAQYVQLLSDHYERLLPPVQRSTGTRDVDGIEVDDFFKEGGYLAQLGGSSYRVREGQVALSAQVTNAQHDAHPYLLEAGTGVGKTLAYLIPLLLNGNRVYAATHTKNLQDQAWNKDIPTALRAFERAGLERSASILKGKTNYFSPQLLENSLDDLPTFLSGSDEKAYAFAALLHWAVSTNTGYLSEIEGVGQQTLIQTFSREKASPAGDDVWASRDPYRKAVEAAQMADLVLLNHSLVFALAKQGQPEADEINAIVFDEAHNIEHVATEALTLDFDGWSILEEIKSLLSRDAAGRVRGLLEAVIEHDQVKTNPIISPFREVLFQFEERLKRWCAVTNSRFIELGKNREDTDVDTPLVFEINAFWTDDVRSITLRLNDDLVRLNDSLRTLVDQFLRIPNIPRRLQSRLLGSLGSLLEHLQDAQAALQELLGTNPELIFWGEANVSISSDMQQMLFAKSEEWRGVLHVTPLDVAAWLQSTLPNLYAHRIYMSATLAIGDDFEGAIRQLGLVGEEPITQVFPSPFNYRQQALIAVPTDLPYPQTSDDALYVEALSSYIAELAKISDGRALILFTSRRTLNEIAPRLEALLYDNGCIILAQNPHNRTAIVERFRRAPDTGEKIVLLGLRSFWEGVDFPNTLKILVISRLPFDFYGHPVSAARREFYLSQGFDRDFFHEVVIPTTLLHLRQMVGRLIRTETDYGVCVIADPRIQAKFYGRYMLKQLLDSQRAIGPRAEILERVRQFLENPMMVEDLFELEPVSELAETLSGEQKAIILSPTQRMLVEATAGSGKTRTLVERILALITSGRAQPNQILVLTFTNKARDVMLTRLEKALEPAAFLTISLNVLTYHRFAARIIRSVQLGDPVFLNEQQEEQVYILNRARQVAGISIDDFSDEDAVAAISFAQNGLIDEEELAGLIPNLPASLAKVATFFLEYVSQLRERNLLDYGEAIVRAVRALRENTAIRQLWSSKFKWIFCDEYQDTTPAQAALIGLIGQNSNILVVGDSAQSIYAWSGADPDNLSRFAVDFPGAATFSLSTNYRCFPNLVRTAETFLRNTGQLSGGNIRFDDRRDGEQTKVNYLSTHTTRSEAETIVDSIRTILADSETEIPHTVAVLARTWALLGQLEEACIRQQICYKFEGTAATGLAANAGIQPSIERAAQLVKEAQSGRATGDSTHDRAVNDIRNGGIGDAEQLLSLAAEVIGNPQRQANEVQKFRYCLSLLSGMSIDAFMQVFRHFYEAQTDANPLVLSTIHSQKGEEFDTVFVIGLEVYKTPNRPPRQQDQMLAWRRLVQQHSKATWRAALSHAQLERAYEQEEERIFYVAMTRAKHNLIVCTCAQRGKPSHFLDLAYSQGAVEQLTTLEDVAIQREKVSVEPEYRTDGRRYLTNAGIFVASKSEMLLANELHRRGMYFEYEEPLASVPFTLPDFTFPDYGGVILEHLGMLDKEDYKRRWEVKAQKYRAQGIQFFVTTEESIEHLQATVDDLRLQFHSLLIKPQQSRMIELIERMRQSSELIIGRAVGDIKDGLMRVDGHPIYIAVKVAVSGDADAPLTDQVDNVYVDWQKLVVGGVNSWVATPR